MTTPPIAPESSTDGVPAVDAVHTGVTPGEASIAVRGHSANGRGVSGFSHVDYAMRSHSDQLSGIRATSYDGVGVEGECLTRPDGTSGGPAGSGGTAAGVAGSSAAGAGVSGTGTTAGVVGMSAAGAGVIGNGKTAGVEGTCAAGAGVVGNGTTGGSFDGQFEGIHAVGHHQSAAGIAGYNDSTGPGIFGKSTSGPAGYFEGDVVVTGDVRLTGADLAEHFSVGDPGGAEPGTVMVLDGIDHVRMSDCAYDPKVIGIVSGAQSYRPGVVLDHQADVPGRQPLALVGKAFCKVDASFGAVEVGDLLTTSATPGHAMKAVERDRALGAVLGKAMGSLRAGCGLVPVLVTLQ
jgi:hypothetical protein